MTPDERQHQRRMARYQRQVTAIYDDLCREAARIGRVVPFQAGGDFDLDHYPSQKKQLAALIREAAADIEATIESAVEQEWHESEAKNDDLLQRAKPARLTAALKAFKARKEAGLRLSDRVWNIASQTEADLTEALSRGIAQGQDARSLTKSVREYLRDPTSMWRRYWEGTGESRQRFWRRRVVDESGRVRFVKQPLSHPGRGVYRSAYKNALRLTATETNIAYRTADHEQWRPEPLVLGIRISISNNHPVEDICDLLGGPKNIYPRDFKFTGWHPFCRCAPVPVLPKEEERIDYLRRMARGEDVSRYPFKGRAEELPLRFKGWLKDNQERIDGAKQLPYFIKDNKKMISAGVSLSEGMSEFKLIGSGKKEIDIVITDELSDYSLPSGVRLRLNEISSLKTYNQFKAYFKEQHGIDFTTDFEDLIQNHADEDIVTVRKMGQKFAVAVESYKEVFGPNSLRKLKRINIFDKGDDVGGQAAYFFNKIGEHDPWAGTIRVSSNNLDGYSIFHELAHVMQDSVALRGEDAITCAERLVKTAKLNPKMKAYFGASSEAMEAERMADAFGYGFGRGRKMGIDFIHNVWQEVHNSGMHMERDRLKQYKKQKSTLHSDKFAINPKTQDVASLQTKQLRQSANSRKSFIRHARSEEALEAAGYAWNNPHELKFKRKSPLGEGKNPKDPKDAANIKAKQRRGIKYFNIYEMEYKGKTWTVGMEAHKEGFEKFYYIE